MTADITALALQYGRYGYRRIAAMLHQAGWIVNVKRVERIWRREGLNVPSRQPKRGRLWLNDSSCIRLQPEYPNDLRSYDFVEDRTHNGKKIRMLNVIDEFTRECVAIRVERKLKAVDVIDVLSDLFILRGIPAHAQRRNLLHAQGAKDHHRGLAAALQHRTSALHSSLNYKPPAPEATVWRVRTDRHQPGGSG